MTSPLYCQWYQVQMGFVLCSIKLWKRNKRLPKVSCRKVGTSSFQNRSQKPSLVLNPSNSGDMEWFTNLTIKKYEESIILLWYKQNVAFPSCNEIYWCLGLWQYLMFITHQFYCRSISRDDIIILDSLNYIKGIMCTGVQVLCVLCVQAYRYYVYYVYRLE